MPKMSQVKGNKHLILTHNHVEKLNYESDILLVQNSCWYANLHNMRTNTGVGNFAQWGTFICVFAFAINYRVPREKR